MTPSALYKQLPTDGVAVPDLGERGGKIGFDEH